MSSKRVIILGLLASLLLIFLCIFFNAERYYKELGLDTKSSREIASTLPTMGINGEEPLKDVNDKTPVAIVGTEDNDTLVVETKEEDKVEAITSEIKEESSTFSYYHEDNKTFILGSIPLLDDGDSFKAYIANCSKEKLCENNVTFLDNEETLSWKGLATSIVTLFDNEKVKNPKLLIDKKDITIEGEFPSQIGKDQLLTLLDDQSETYKISDKTMVTSKDDNTTTDKILTKVPIIDVNTTDEKNSTDTVTVSENELSSKQEEISLLLKNNKINFKKNSGKIQKDGKKILDKVLASLSGKENILIEVQGHTDAGGKEKVNLRISQMRADGVKKYLVKKGLKAKNITAKGYGEKKLLLPKKPYSSENRRVEIYLKRK